MKRLLFLFVTVLFLSISVQAQEWKNHTSVQGKFSVEYLGDLEENTKETDKAITYKTNITNGSMAYLISSTQHKSNLEDNIDELMNVSIKSFKDNIQGSIEDFKRINLNDVQGTYVLFSLSEDSVKLEYYLFMKGEFQYQIVFYSETTTYNQEEADHIINSFNILD